MGLEAAIAVTRFGLGARMGEIESVGTDAAEWLRGQLDPSAPPRFPDGSLLSSSVHLQAFFDARIVRREARGRSATPEVDPEAVQSFSRHVRRTLISEIAARSRFGEETDAPFHERLTRFWSNHFSVSSQKFQVAAIAGAYEREAIRPHILGHFPDLAEAAIFHPAMLVYLDNWQSIGPNSRVGKRRNRGLNENLAREVLELHTVTPSAGYTQADVTEFARALTGWTIGNPRLGNNQIGQTIFASRIHEDGERILLGRRHDETGEQQARAIVRDLSLHPATASNIARKLARHFTRDDPPASLVERLKQRFLETEGNLADVCLALVESPEVWDPSQGKLKTPDDLLTSTSRILGLQSVFAGEPRDVFDSFAQIPFGAPSPEGWPDSASAWIGPDSLSKRIEWAQRLGRRQVVTDARKLLEEALGDLVSAETRRSVARAETDAQGLALALMSPEFQRR